MRRKVSLFYGYEEIADILFNGFHTITTVEQFEILNDAVRMIDKLLPYNWSWDVAKYTVIAPSIDTKMEVNEHFRKIMWGVVHHIRKELLDYDKARNV